jgi:hypothetical protein
MSKRTTDSALAEIYALVNEIDQLKTGHRNSASHVRWGVGALEFLEQVFGRNSRIYLSFAQLKWHNAGNFFVGGPGDPQGSWDPQTAVERKHHEAYLRDLESARGVLLAARDALTRSGIDAVYEGKDTAPEASGIVKVLSLAERKLRKVIRIVPEKERDVQDAMENLLIGADIPFQREGPSIEYSSKKYIPDFAFERLDLVLEAKLCNKADREKALIAEINDDILAYRTRFGNVVFLVYDTGFIRDVDRFAAAFESTENVIVRVIKH